MQIKSDEGNCILKIQIEITIRISQHHGLEVKSDLADIIPDLVYLPLAGADRGVCTGIPGIPVIWFCFLVQQKFLKRV